jgi:hypothetical protein
LVVADGVLAWRDALDVLKQRLGPLFVRPEPRRQAGLYLEPAYQPRDPTQVADFRGSDGGSGRMAAISPITRGEATAAAKIVLLDQWV